MIWDHGANGRDAALRGPGAIAHMLVGMLRIPKGRAPWPAARGLCFMTGIEMPLIAATAKKMGCSEVHKSRRNVRELEWRM